MLNDKDKCVFKIFLDAVQVSGWAFCFKRYDFKEAL